MTFVGVEAGNECWGGVSTSNYFIHGAFTTEACDAACSDPGFTCGGAGALAVYSLPGEKHFLSWAIIAGTNKSGAQQRTK
jgi:hypothetical protein